MFMTIASLSFVSLIGCASNAVPRMPWFGANSGASCSYGGKCVNGACEIPVRQTESMNQDAVGSDMPQGLRPARLAMVAESEAESESQRIPDGPDSLFAAFRSFGNANAKQESRSRGLDDLGSHPIRSRSDQAAAATLTRFQPLPKPIVR